MVNSGCSLSRGKRVRLARGADVKTGPTGAFRAGLTGAGRAALGGVGTVWCLDAAAAVDIAGVASPVFGGIGRGEWEVDCWVESSENLGAFGLRNGCARNSGTCLGGATRPEASCSLAGLLACLTTIGAGSCRGMGGGRRARGAGSPAPESGLT